MVARRASLDPPRPRQIAGQDTAQGRPGAVLVRHPEKAAPIRRLKGEHLAGIGERPFDLGERGRRAGGQHQFARRILADAGETRQIEQMRGLQRPAETAFRAAADQL